ncbi:MAG TPA: hypothetical protein VGW80_03890 [Solirubrobacterales bacterium]|nr:hypothetical protein [Solirubrobacterales bacterium]
MSRGRKYRHLGWLGVLFSALVIAEGSLSSLVSDEVRIWAGTGLAISLLLVNWTRIWVKESREPFKYTYSVAEFEQGPEVSRGSQAAGDPIRWLGRDLTEKLGDRVRRLCFLEDGDGREHDPDQGPEPHVHISGWYGLRQAEDEEWWIEVVPKVRVGGKGAPAELGSTVHFKLDRNGSAARNASLPPALDMRQYNLLVERVYWAVASKIYSQIRRGVEEKAVLLPPGRLRSAAYLNEAHDYARSNTLSAFKAARRLYRQACESYDRSSFERSSSIWRRLMNGLRGLLDRGLEWLRRQLSRLIRQVGQREVRAAEAQLGYARMLVAEWNLRFLCGSIPKELYDAPGHICKAIERLHRLPSDIPGRKRALFRAYVTLALARSDLQNPTGAKEALQKATRLEPADAAEDAEFLLGEAIIAGDPIRSLRLLSRAVERNPKHERARFMKASQLEQLWRRQSSFEPAPAEVVDGEYAEVIGLDPGNVSAWANRGYVGWLLSKADPSQERTPPGRRSWRRRGISSLNAGVRYKEVRRDAMVGELNWSLTRFRAEEGEFAGAYENYLEAVSAMLGEPRMGFVEDFYKGAGPALLKRYKEYEKQVREQARARLSQNRGEARMVKSVLAFVLNDCGGAHYAYHQRWGDPAAREHAISMFRAAIRKNPRFMLPQFNLAVIEGEMAEEKEEYSPSERAAYLVSARKRLREIIQIEQHWTFPRLRIAELEARLSRLQGEVARAAAQDPEWSKPAPYVWLRTLLPHEYLWEKDQPGGKIDGKGEYVDRLVKRKIRWGKDFNEVQVEVLIHWAGVLADEAPEKAIRLSRKLQEAFYEAHPLLLESRIRAAKKLRRRRNAKPGQYDEEIRSCESLQKLFLFTELQEDPVHYANLRKSFERLTPTQQKEIAERAALAGPEKAVASLLDELTGRAAG